MDFTAEACSKGCNMPLKSAICEHQENLDTVLDSVADGIFTVDTELRITHFNRAAEEITGFTKTEAIGQPCHKIFHSSVCLSDCPIKEALATNRSVTNREFDIFNKDRRKIPISISASVLRNAKGEAIGGVEVFRDLSFIISLKKEIENKYSFHDMISRAPNMLRLFDVLPDISASDATVLIHGESGTGKELFSRAIHDLSPRHNGPLVVINCGALPEPLLEAEIFGAKRGAYTGSVENRPGRLEMAQGGTLFLDEIGDLPLALQVKLLRVLENKEFQPLGAKQPQKADVRFITATHRNIEQMVEEGSFRRDLYFRINVVALSIPPLRDRHEDVPLLIDITLNRLNKSYGKKIRGISPAVMQMLLRHDYPGNVRELLNLLEQMVILCRSGEIGPEHLPEGLQAHLQSHHVDIHPRQNISKTTLLEILNRHEGNRSQVAKELGIDRTTLWRWMKRFDIDKH
jgi:two-component system, NtrC family, response regulator HydG